MMMLVGEFGSTPTSGLTVITVLVVLAFAIDRITAGILFLLSFDTLWNKKFPEPILQETVAGRLAAEKRQKLIYFVYAASLAVLILFFADQVRVLNALGFQSLRPAVATNTAAAPAATPSPQSATANAVTSTETEQTTRSFRLLDFLVTALVLVGGADRIEQLLKRSGGSGGSSSSEAKPLEIKGKITVEDESKKH
jgi:hypothetical protein